LILWGTGLGVASTDSHALAENDVWVEFQNRQLGPTYAGPAPGFSGLDQINVRLPPADVPERGCYIPLRVVANGVISNTVTLSFSETPGTCQHPLGFSTEILRRLDSSGAVSVGEIQLSRHGVFDTNLIPGAEAMGYGFASATFYHARAEGVALISGLPKPPLGCRPAAGIAGAILWLDASDFPRGLDAGPFLTGTGPSGLSVRFEKRVGTPVVAGNYLGPDSLPGSTLQAGPWKVSGTGGTGVGAFEVEVTVMPRFLFGHPSLVRRNRPVTISWPTAGLSDSQVVAIDFSVNITVPGGEFSATTRSAGISCQAPALAGRVTIPVEVLQTLPSEHDGTGSFRFTIESIPAVFRAEGLDYGIARASVLETRSVNVQ